VELHSRHNHGTMLYVCRCHLLGQYWTSRVWCNGNHSRKVDWHKHNESDDESALQGSIRVWTEIDSTSWSCSRNGGRTPRTTQRILDIAEEMTEHGKKRIIIIAGPNGAGKTTFAREFLPNEAACPAFINADLIAAGLSPFQPEHVAIKAGKLMLQEMVEHVEHERSFAFETTLAGRGYVNKIRDWRKQGYTVKLFFLALGSVDESIARIAERVAQGGHHVPDEVVRRRFEAGLTNFKSIYRFEVNYWRWYDNSGDVPTVIDEGENL
jgi:predicted ABC-type ATPase